MAELLGWVSERTQVLSLTQPNTRSYGDRDSIIGLFKTSKPGNEVCWTGATLTLKGPITTAADDILKYFFIVFQRK